jgi:transcriptional antiterminator NusG
MTKSSQKIKEEDEVLETTESTEVVATEEIVSETEEDKVRSLLDSKPIDNRRWYVIHTYSGYEDQVALNLEQRIQSMNMEDKIFAVLVPKEKQIEIRNGKRKTVENRVFPGYVLVQMLVTEDSWYVVRNTPNVTGFIGFGVHPTPISEEEVERIKKRMGIDEPKYEIDFENGDLVRITDGALKNFEAKVQEVDRVKGKIKVSVNMFGRETPVTLDSLQVKKI